MIVAIGGRLVYRADSEVKIVQARYRY